MPEARDIESSRVYYDDYVDRQQAVGINDRHRSILGYLRRFGMKSEDRVLEIGAGVGTLTALIAKELGSRGRLVAVDLSPRSIDVARDELTGYENLELIAGDILELEIPGRFDVVVLPDVIEHIPLEHHGRLFERISGWVSPGGFVLLHYPNPNYLEWCHTNKREVLQAIDQPIQSDVLTANAYPHGLYLDYLETYSIWVREGDYTVAVLRRKADASDWEELPWQRPLRQKVREALGSRARRLVRRSSQ
jgi:cyclopropane fatty-acyl-phospholipid synthase-like methyltransferase